MLYRLQNPWLILVILSNQMQFLGLDIERTIVALATAPVGPDQPSLRHIVRLAGPDCLRVASAMLDDVQPAIDEDRGFTTHRATLLLRRPSLPIPVSLLYFRAGRSYTGQSMLELHLPGSAALAERAVDELLAAGASPAQPGEFTLRAVLCGRMDLTGAEAVAALVAARGDAQIRAAMQLAEGRLTRRCGQINDHLADLLAEVEAALDFADEPLEFSSPQAVAVGLAQARSNIAELQAQAGRIEALEHRPTVGLLGRPNVGKSSLLNRITGLARAMCSPLPGTTRDILSATLPLPAGEALLLDSAGMDDPNARAAGSAHRLPGDPDVQAQRAARTMAATADLLIIVLDVTKPLAAQLAMLAWPEIANRPRIVVANKIDLLAGEMGNAPPNSAVDLAVSAVTGQGLDDLKQAICDRLTLSADRPTEQLMLNARHRATLADTDAALARAAELLADGAAPDELLAGQLREAIEYLGHISGRIVTEDLLGRIFSRFCLGK